MNKLSRYSNRLPFSSGWNSL